MILFQVDGTGGGGGRRPTVDVQSPSVRPQSNPQTSVSTSVTNTARQNPAAAGVLQNAGEQLGQILGHEAPSMRPLDPQQIAQAQSPLHRSEFFKGLPKQIPGQPPSGSVRELFSRLRQAHNPEEAQQLLRQIRSRLFPQTQNLASDRARLQYLNALTQFENIYARGMEPLEGHWRDLEHAVQWTDARESETRIQTQGRERVNQLWQAHLLYRSCGEAAEANRLLDQLIHELRDHTTTSSHAQLSEGDRHALLVRAIEAKVEMHQAENLGFAMHDLEGEIRRLHAQGSVDARWEAHALLVEYSRLYRSIHQNFQPAVLSTLMLINPQDSNRPANNPLPEAMDLSRVTNDLEAIARQEGNLAARAAHFFQLAAAHFQRGDAVSTLSILGEAENVLREAHQPEELVRALMVRQYTECGLGEHLGGRIEGWLQADEHRLQGMNSRQRFEVYVSWTGLASALYENHQETAAQRVFQALQSQIGRYTLATQAQVYHQLLSNLLSNGTSIPEALRNNILSALREGLQNSHATWQDHMAIREVMIRHSSDVAEIAASLQDLRSILTSRNLTDEENLQIRNLLVRGLLRERELTHENSFGPLTIGPQGLRTVLAEYRIDLQSAQESLRAGGSLSRNPEALNLLNHHYQELMQLIHEAGDSYFNDDAQERLNVAQGLPLPERAPMEGVKTFYQEYQDFLGGLPPETRVTSLRSTMQTLVEQGQHERIRDVFLPMFARSLEGMTPAQRLQALVTMSPVLSEERSRLDAAIERSRPRYLNQRDEDHEALKLLRQNIVGQEVALWNALRDAPHTPSAVKEFCNGMIQIAEGHPETARRTLQGILNNPEFRNAEDPQSQGVLRLAYAAIGGDVQDRTSRILELVDGLANARQTTWLQEGHTGELAAIQRMRAELPRFLSTLPYDQLPTTFEEALNRFASVDDQHRQWVDEFSGALSRIPRRFEGANAQRTGSVWNLIRAMDHLENPAQIRNALNALQGVLHDDVSWNVMSHEGRGDLGFALQDVALMLIQRTPPSETQLRQDIFNLRNEIPEAEEWGTWTRETFNARTAMEVALMAAAGYGATFVAEAALARIFAGGVRLAEGMSAEVFMAQRSSTLAARAALQRVGIGLGDAELEGMLAETLGSRVMDRAVFQAVKGVIHSTAFNIYNSPSSLMFGNGSSHIVRASADMAIDTAINDTLFGNVLQTLPVFRSMHGTVLMSLFRHALSNTTFLMAQNIRHQVTLAGFQAFSSRYQELQIERQSLQRLFEQTGNSEYQAQIQRIDVEIAENVGEVDNSIRGWLGNYVRFVGQEVAERQMGIHAHAPEGEDPAVTAQRRERILDDVLNRRTRGEADRYVERPEVRDRVEAETRARYEEGSAEHARLRERAEREVDAEMAAEGEAPTAGAYRGIDRESVRRNRVEERTRLLVEAERNSYRNERFQAERENFVSRHPDRNREAIVFQGLADQGVFERYSPSQVDAVLNHADRVFPPSLDASSGAHLRSEANRNYAQHLFERLSPEFLDRHFRDPLSALRSAQAVADLLHPPSAVGERSRENSRIFDHLIQHAAPEFLREPERFVESVNQAREVLNNPNIRAQHPQLRSDQILMILISSSLPSAGSEAARRFESPVALARGLAEGRIHLRDIVPPEMRGLVPQMFREGDALVALSFFRVELAREVIRKTQPRVGRRGEGKREKGDGERGVARVQAGVPLPELHFGMTAPRPSSEGLAPHEVRQSGASTGEEARTEQEREALGFEAGGVQADAHGQGGEGRGEEGRGGLPNGSQGERSDSASQMGNPSDAATRMNAFGEMNNAVDNPTLHQTEGMLPGRLERQMRGQGVDAGVYVDSGGRIGGGEAPSLHPPSSLMERVNTLPPEHAPVAQILSERSAALPEAERVRPLTDAEFATHISERMRNLLQRGDASSVELLVAWIRAERAAGSPLAEHLSEALRIYESAQRQAPVEATTEVNSTPSPVFDEAWAKTQKVLLVDDDSMVLRSFARPLKTSGHKNITTATSGSEALDWFRENPDAALITLDYMMLDMDGPTTARALRDAGYRGPIVFISGEANLPGVAEIENSTLIIKPVSGPQLSQRIVEQILANAPRGESHDLAAAEAAGTLRAPPVPGDILETAPETGRANDRGSNTAFASSHMMDDPGVMGVHGADTEFPLEARMQARLEGRSGLASVDSGNRDGGGGLWSRVRQAFGVTSRPEAGTSRVIQERRSLRGEVYLAGKASERYQDFNLEIIGNEFRITDTCSYGIWVSQDGVNFRALPHNTATAIPDGAFVLYREGETEQCVRVWKGSAPRPEVIARPLLHSESFSIAPEMNIVMGRESQGVHIHVPGDPKISRRSAELFINSAEDGEMWVRNLSTNPIILYDNQGREVRRLEQNQSASVTGRDVQFTLGDSSFQATYDSLLGVARLRSTQVMGLGEAYPVQRSRYQFSASPVSVEDSVRAISLNPSSPRNLKSAPPRANRFGGRFSTQTDMGRGYSKNLNEDTFAHDAHGEWFVVGDGMGGMGSGDIASAHGMIAISEEMEGHGNLYEALLEGDRAIRNLPPPQNQGGMCVAGYRLIEAGQKTYAHIVHSGDSRVMHFTRREGRLRVEFITRDQASLAEDFQIRRREELAGIWRAEGLSEAQINERMEYVLDDEIRSHPMANIVRGGIGAAAVRNPTAPEETLREIRPGDVLMACSDGIENLSLAEIEEILNTSRSPQEAQERVVQRALDKMSLLEALRSFTSRGPVNILEILQTRRPDLLPTYQRVYGNQELFLKLDQYHDREKRYYNQERTGTSYNVYNRAGQRVDHWKADNITVNVYAHAIEAPAQFEAASPFDRVSHQAPAQQVPVEAHAGDGDATLLEPVRVGDDDATHRREPPQRRDIQASLSILSRDIETDGPGREQYTELLRAHPDAIRPEDLDALFPLLLSEEEGEWALGVLAMLYQDQSYPEVPRLDPAAQSRLVGILRGLTPETNPTMWEDMTQRGDWDHLIIIAPHLSVRFQGALGARLVSQEALNHSLILNLAWAVSERNNMGAREILSAALRRSNETRRAEILDHVRTMRGGQFAGLAQELEGITGRANTRGSNTAFASSHMMDDPTMTALHGNNVDNPFDAVGPSRRMREQMEGRTGMPSIDSGQRDGGGGGGGRVEGRRETPALSEVEGEEVGAIHESPVQEAASSELQNVGTAHPGETIHVPASELMGALITDQNVSPQVRAQLMAQYARDCVSVETSGVIARMMLPLLTPLMFALMGRGVPLETIARVFERMGLNVRQENPQQVLARREEAARQADEATRLPGRRERVVLGEGYRARPLDPAQEREQLHARLDSEQESIRDDVCEQILTDLNISNNADNAPYIDAIRDSVARALLEDKEAVAYEITHGSFESILRRVVRTAGFKNGSPRVAAALVRQILDHANTPAEANALVQRYLRFAEALKASGREVSEERMVALFESGMSAREALARLEAEQENEGVSEEVPQSPERIRIDAALREHRFRDFLEIVKTNAIAISHSDLAALVREIASTNHGMEAAAVALEMSGLGLGGKGDALPHSSRRSDNAARVQRLLVELTPTQVEHLWKEVQRRCASGSNVSVPQEYAPLLDLVEATHGIGAFGDTLLEHLLTERRAPYNDVEHLSLIGEVVRRASSGEDGAREVLERAVSSENRAAHPHSVEMIEQAISRARSAEAVDDTAALKASLRRRPEQGGFRVETPEQIAARAAREAAEARDAQAAREAEEEGVPAARTTPSRGIRRRGGGSIGIATPETMGVAALGVLGITVLPRLMEIMSGVSSITQALVGMTGLALLAFGAGAARVMETDRPAPRGRVAQNRTPVENTPRTQNTQPRWTADLPDNAHLTAVYRVFERYLTASLGQMQVRRNDFERMQDFNRLPEAVREQLWQLSRLYQVQPREVEQVLEREYQAIVAHPEHLGIAAILSRAIQAVERHFNERYGIPENNPVETASAERPTVRAETFASMQISNADLESRQGAEESEADFILRNRRELAERLPQDPEVAALLQRVRSEDRTALFRAVNSSQVRNPVQAREFLNGCVQRNTQNLTNEMMTNPELVALARNISPRERTELLRRVRAGEISSEREVREFLTSPDRILDMDSMDVTALEETVHPETAQAARTQNPFDSPPLQVLVSGRNPNGQQCFVTKGPYPAATANVHQELVRVEEVTERDGEPVLRLRRASGQVFEVEAGVSDVSSYGVGEEVYFVDLNPPLVPPSTNTNSSPERMIVPAPSPGHGSQATHSIPIQGVHDWRLGHLQGGGVIGRDTAIFADSSVANQHCVVDRVPDGSLFVQNVEPHQTFLVNARGELTPVPQEGARVRHGQVIQIGQTRLRLVAEGGSPFVFEDMNGLHPIQNNQVKLSFRNGVWEGEGHRIYREGIFRKSYSIEIDASLGVPCQVRENGTWRSLRPGERYSLSFQNGMSEELRFGPEVWRMTSDGTAHLISGRDVGPGEVMEQLAPTVLRVSQGVHNYLYPTEAPRVEHEREDWNYVNADVFLAGDGRWYLRNQSLPEKVLVYIAPEGVPVSNVMEEGRQIPPNTYTPLQHGQSILVRMGQGVLSFVRFEDPRMGPAVPGNRAPVAEPIPADRVDAQRVVLHSAFQGAKFGIDLATSGLPILRNAAGGLEIDLPALGIDENWQTDAEWNSTGIRNHGAVHAFSHQGIGGKDHNEDRYVVVRTQDGRSVLLVLDGMGGFEGAERAAEIVRRVAQRALEQGQSLEHSIALAHYALRQDANRSNSRVPVGDVVAMAVELRPNYYHRMTGQAHSRNFPTRFLGNGDSEALVLDFGQADPVVYHSSRPRHESPRAPALQVRRDSSGRALRGETMIVRQDPHANVVNHGIKLDGYFDIDQPREELSPGQLVLVGCDGFFENYGSHDRVVDVLRARGVTHSAEALAVLREDVLVRQALLHLSTQSGGALEITEDLYRQAFAMAFPGQTLPADFYQMYSQSTQRHLRRDVDGNLQRNADGDLLYEEHAGPFYVFPDGGVIDSNGRTVDHFKIDNVTLMVHEVGGEVSDQGVRVTEVGGPIAPPQVSSGSAQAAPLAQAARTQNPFDPLRATGAQAPAFRPGGGVSNISSDIGDEPLIPRAPRDIEDPSARFVEPVENAHRPVEHGVVPTSRENLAQAARTRSPFDANPPSVTMRDVNPGLSPPENFIGREDLESRFSGTRLPTARCISREAGRWHVGGLVASEAWVNAYRHETANHSIPDSRVIPSGMLFAISHDAVVTAVHGVISSRGGRTQDMTFLHTGEQVRYYRPAHAGESLSVDVEMADQGRNLRVEEGVVSNRSILKVKRTFRNSAGEVVAECFSTFQFRPNDQVFANPVRNFPPETSERNAGAVNIGQINRFAEVSGDHQWLHDATAVSAQGARSPYLHGMATFNIGERNLPGEANFPFEVNMSFGLPVVLGDQLSVQQDASGASLVQVPGVERAVARMARRALTASDIPHTTNTVGQNFSNPPLATGARMPVFRSGGGVSFASPSAPEPGLPREVGALEDPSARFVEPVENAHRPVEHGVVPTSREELPQAARTRSPFDALPANDVRVEERQPVLYEVPSSSREILGAEVMADFERTFNVPPGQRMSEVNLAGEMNMGLYEGIHRQTANLRPEQHVMIHYAQPNGSHVFVVDTVEHLLSPNIIQVIQGRGRVPFRMEIKISEGNHNTSPRIRFHLIEIAEALRTQLSAQGILGSMLAFAKRQFPDAIVETQAANIISALLLGRSLHQVQGVRVEDESEHPISCFMAREFIDVLEQRGVLNAAQATELRNITIQGSHMTNREDYILARRTQHNRFFEMLAANNKDPAQNVIQFMTTQLGREGLRFLRDHHYVGDFWLEGSVLSPDSPQALEANRFRRSRNAPSIPMAARNSNPFDANRAPVLEFSPADLSVEGATDVVATVPNNRRRAGVFAAGALVLLGTIARLADAFSASDVQQNTHSLPPENATALSAPARPISDASTLQHLSVENNQSQVLAMGRREIAQVSVNAEGNIQVKDQGAFRTWIQRVQQRNFDRPQPGVACELHEGDVVVLGTSPQDGNAQRFAVHRVDGKWSLVRISSSNTPPPSGTDVSRTSSQRH